MNFGKKSKRKVNEMQESEARKKWCPMARMPIQTYKPESNYKIVSANRDEDDQPSSYCYGSGCMMWRVKIDQFECSKGCVQPQKSISFMKCTCGGKLTVIKSEGFCGLAGQEI